MDSGLFWSVLAKWRGRIEPRWWRILTTVVGKPDAGFLTRRGDGAFPWLRRLCLGTPILETHMSPNPKRRRAGAPRQPGGYDGHRRFRSGPGSGCRRTPKCLVVLPWSWAVRNP